MKRNSAFTLNELAIVLFIILLIFVFLGIISGGFMHGHGHGGGRQMQNSTQVRGIQAGLVLFAQGNNSYYPGLTSLGEIDESVGLTTQDRITRLIEDNYFSLQYARSPVETQTNTTSYALLQVDVAADGQTVPEDDRNAEWKDTTNSESVVISDRAVPVNGSYTTINSIHSTVRGAKPGWTGSVGWNDNHVTFESTSFLSTKYGKKSHLIDALFATPGDAHSGDDAFMVWSGTSDL